MKLFIFRCKVWVSIESLWFEYLNAQISLWNNRVRMLGCYRSKINGGKNFSTTMNSGLVCVLKIHSLNRTRSGRSNSIRRRREGVFSCLSFLSIALCKWMQIEITDKFGNSKWKYGDNLFPFRRKFEINSGPSWRDGDASIDI